MTNEVGELKPCPFCGSEKVCLDLSGGILVCCNDCHCDGPESASDADAIAAWNRRAVIEAVPSPVLIKEEGVSGGRLPAHALSSAETDAQHSAGWSLEYEGYGDFKLLLNGRGAFWLGVTKEWQEGDSDELHALINRAALPDQAPSLGGLRGEIARMRAALESCVACLDGLPDPEHVDFALTKAKAALSPLVVGVGSISSVAQIAAAGPSACAATPPHSQSEAGKRAVNDVWRQIDALGGTHTPEDRESGYGEAYDAAVNAAIGAVEALGGEWN